MRALPPCSLDFAARHVGNQGPRHSGPEEPIDEIQRLLADEEHWYVGMDILKKKILSDRRSTICVSLGNYASVINTFAQYYDIPKVYTSPHSKRMTSVKEAAPPGSAMEIPAFDIDSALRFSIGLSATNGGHWNDLIQRIRIANHPFRTHDGDHVGIILGSSHEQIERWLRPPAEKRPLRSVTVISPTSDARSHDCSKTSQDPWAITLPKLSHDHSQLASVSVDLQERRRYEHLKTMPVATWLEPDDFDFMNAFRAKMIKRRSDDAKEVRRIRDLKKAKDVEALNWMKLLWVELLGGQLSEEFKDSRDALWAENKLAQRNRRRNRVTSRGVDDFKKERQSVRELFESTVDQSAARLRKLCRTLQVPQGKCWVSIPTNKGFRVLQGESPHVTATIHRTYKRDIERALIDFEISLPAGFRLHPEMAGYAAARIATRFKIDPVRCTAGTHIGLDENNQIKEESKAHPGSPVCDHLHMAMPVVSSDPVLFGLALDKSLLHGWLQLEVAAIQRHVCDIPYHVAPIVAAHIDELRKGRAHMRWLGKPEDFTDERVALFKSKGWIVSADRQSVEIPFQSTDEDVARLPLPNPEHRCPLGVPHINKTSDKRRRLMKLDQKKAQKVSRELIQLTEEHHHLTKELTRLLAYISGDITTGESQRIHLIIKNISNIDNKTKTIQDQLRLVDCLVVQCAETTTYAAY